jgi:ferredoxin, 2Fe-2S
MRGSQQNERVVSVVDYHARGHEIAALDGWRLMEVIRDWGVDESSIDRLGTPSDDGVSRFDEVPTLESTSCLRRQLAASKTSGLCGRLAPASEKER